MREEAQRMTSLEARQLNFLKTTLPSMLQPDYLAGTRISGLSEDASICRVLLHSARG